MSEYSVSSNDYNCIFGLPGSKADEGVYQVDVITGDELVVFDLLLRAVAAMYFDDNNVRFVKNEPLDSGSSVAFFYRRGDVAKFMNGAIVVKINRYTEPDNPLIKI